MLGFSPLRRIGSRSKSKSATTAPRSFRPWMIGPAKKWGRPKNGTFLFSPLPKNGTSKSGTSPKSETSPKMADFPQKRGLPKKNRLTHRDSSPEPLPARSAPRPWRSRPASRRRWRWAKAQTPGAQKPKASEQQVAAGRWPVKWFLLGAEADLCVFHGIFGGAMGWGLSLEKPRINP